MIPSSTSFVPPAKISSSVVVIVPVYNRPTLSIKTLASVLAQTVLPHRLIIVDDGSTDATATCINGWITAQSSPVRIELHQLLHGGVGRARNAGLALAPEASLVAFLDSDDCWPSDFLERTVMALDAMPDALAVSTDQVFDPPDGGLNQRALDLISTRWLLINGAGIGSCTLFRRNAVVQAGGYDESILSGADLALFLDISTHGAWAHAKGAPVTMLRGHQKHAGESGNLSLSRADNWSIWASIVSRFLARHGARSGLSDADKTQLLKLRWTEAARNLVAGQCYKEACIAYERALAPLDYLKSLS